MVKRRCLFLDRDGVINVKAPNDEYIRQWSEFRFLPGIARLIRLFNVLDFLVIVVTNQRGVSRQLMGLEDLELIHRNMRDALAQEGARVDDILYCPHGEGECECRKPRPGMVKEAEKRWNIDLGASLMIGDSASDHQLAENCGMAFALARDGEIIDIFPSAPGGCGMSMISIIVPTHNELSNLTPLYRRIADVFSGLPGDDFELIFCDDSTDTTPQAIADLRANDKRVKLVRLSRRYGQALALSAGLDRASGEAVVMIDADLQDPPETIVQLLERWRAGHEVVYVQRASAGTKFYRTFSRIFYRLLRSIASVEIPVDASEFRLLDRKVVEYLRRLTEKTRYLRGLTVLPGFRQTSIRITRAQRLHGQTNYNLKRSLRVAIDGILSFSTAPLRLATLLGVITVGAAFAVAIVYGVWKLVDPEIFGPLWPGVFVTLLLLGGLQFILLGVLGEYVARIMTEVQNRPAYWVDYELGFGEADAVAAAHIGKRDPVQ